uniref:ABC transporter domain-containing protein n=1 Tax=Mucochytrium quahogii TaxID=96639 RepID=A0A7S2W2R7_9STRA|mmetsp:Transcript_27644/g.44190  ORF Transcript_27644/g.44190 Transcript_27644/m.44190 type:complete len:726 (-) Transcript_27644:907-3084(-)|eukprot:CAMPEP_0203747570 /NCGR_PEP_ID=MMETSP0098-20131031/2679_1 /ASSEMBLY_ACC=CAM_ASM_000208 /TAXON_ID=96639 /ORGANISM=" , Strain NY0313808BC1" /LENGTH=725 /DNA_ID=CAMNT_0050636023 /DNA_START=33 /DNA_END=2210 /DNA_ORIENTATION=-
MASFTIDEAKVGELFAKHLGDLDEEIVEYLSGMVAGCDEPGEDGSGVKELVAPFLESYGAADSEEEAEELAGKLSKMLVDENILVFQEKKVKKKSKLRRPIQAAAFDDDDDTWGLKTVKNQNKANSTVESISDAIGDKKSLQKFHKKLEKEKQKEDAKYAREEEERARMMNSEFDTPVQEANKNKNIRNMSKDVICPNINISVGGGKALFEDAELKIVYGRRYGLIGKNGVGKTTLLKHISHRQIEGFPSHLSVVHVEQEVVADEMTVLECVLKMDVERETLLAKEKELMDKIENATNADSSVSQELQAVYDQLIAIGSDSAEARARGILTGLGFSPEYQMATTRSLSGGWRMRVSLAKALFLAPDVLMLDEPTNHLDLEGIVFLERFLQKSSHSLLLVTHDRTFANNVITDVIHAENQKLVYYKGDIDIFEQTRANQRLQQKREFDSQQAKRAHMQKFVDKFRFNAKRASMAQSRIKALNKMVLVDDCIDDPLFTLQFPTPISELNKVIEIQEVAFGYGGDKDPSKILFEGADFSIDTSSRIVILGPNGCGKSTLLNLILDKMQPVKGYVQRDPKLRMAHFAQHQIEELDLRQCPLEYFLSIFEGSKPDKVRSHLSNYGIPADLAEQKIGSMSGGQKARVAFAKLTWSQPHLLIMDEPSNHLDLESCAALMMAINNFEGGVVLVSHDQHLIEMCADELWVIKDRKLINYQGTLKEYIKWTIAEE